MSVPTSALATAKPYQKPPFASPNTLPTDSVTPEITTVSKPNSRPARLAVTTMAVFFFARSPVPGYVWVIAFPLLRAYKKSELLLIQDVLVIVRHRSWGRNHAEAFRGACSRVVLVLCAPNNLVRVDDRRALPRAGSLAGQR